MATSQFTQDQVNQVLADGACCIAQKNADRINSKWNGEKANCLLNEVLMLAEYEDALGRWIKPDTIIGLIIDSSADVDLTDLTTPTDLLADGMSGNISWTVGGVTTTICVFSGNFLGLTLSDFIDALVLAINNSGTGWTAVNNDPLITIIAPSNLGVNPVGGIVTITLAPYYYLKNAIANLNTAPQALGYSDAITARPAFVSANGLHGNLLYVPNGDSYNTFNATINFNGHSIGDTFAVNIGANRSSVVFGVGQSYFFQATVAGNLYVVFFTVAAPGYVTPNLTITITNIQKNPPTVNNPIDAIGAQSWLMNIGGQGWGTVNVYNVTLSTGALVAAAPPFIEVPSAQVIDAYYDATSDSVFLCGGGSSVSSAIKINCAVNPFAVAGQLILNATGSGIAQSFVFDSAPAIRHFYLDRGNNAIFKFDTNLAYNSGGDIDSTDQAANALLPVNIAPAFAHNPVSGDVYYSAGGTTVLYLNADVNLNIQDTIGISTIPINPLIDFNGVNGDYNTPASSGTGLLQGINYPGGMYYHAGTARLWMIRNTTNPAELELQSYDIFAGDTAAINLTKQVYLLPAGFFPIKMTYQPAKDILMVTASMSPAGTRLYILDPNTGVYNISTVPQSSGITFFSYTDDGVSADPNFFGSTENNTGALRDSLSVISIRNLILEFEGDFTGTVTEILQTAAQNCLDSPDILISNIKGVCGCCTDDENEGVINESIVRFLQGNTPSTFVDANGSYIVIP